MSLLQSGINATKDAVQADLDRLEQGDAAVQVDVLSTGDVEASGKVGVVKGGTVTAFVRTKIQHLKAAVAGVRFSKTFKS
jgi:hypothetical protein